ncbi:P1 family peptidase [Halobacillus sp. A5]|uniref:P1 family peptidase n=1 Tax=Halobacillus sp. A5 TaxID=2880263 RepID=UPI0020A6C7D2|nr:P1 family peptidase [Halobacillus sp. A5]MCP3025929.1 P1 family peptidase [Halobacillus sp. A5]
MKTIDITEMKDFYFGHAQYAEALTGCTVILSEEGAVGGVNVKGGAPGTRETDLLKSENLVQAVHGVFLAGGSAYGLEAGSGVMESLEERGIGFETKEARIPIVPGAILYDLGAGSSNIRPDSRMGKAASEAAFSRAPFKNGNVGAGTGAVVGKIFGNDYAMKGGIGSFAVQVNELQVGAVVAINCFGDIINPYTQQRVAGVYDRCQQTYLKTEQILREQMWRKQADHFSGNTSLGAVVTNAKLTKAESNKLCAVAHNGFARTMMPAHTFVDGDTIFSMSSGKVEVDVNSLSYLYTYAVEQAVLTAAESAESCLGIPANQDAKME